MLVGWFTSAKDKEALELFDYTIKMLNAENIKAQISFIFCNREPSEDEFVDKFFQKANQKKIDFFYLSSKKFKRELFLENKELWRQEFDKEVYKIISKKSFDFCILAGYMLIVSRYLIERIKMINLHPDLPNRYRGSWQDVIRNIIKNKDKEAGAMIHIVTEDLDRGPCLAYATCNIEDLHDKKNSMELIRKRQFSLEFPLIFLTLKLISQGKIDLNNPKSIDLSNEIRNIL